ncbi:hypothetical protein [Spirochaeta dissipatitropha]
MNKEQAKKEIAAIFLRNGYVRLQKPERQKQEGSQVYKKGSEVRLLAKNSDELDSILQMLEVLEISPGKPFKKARQTCIPLYSKKQVARFMELIAPYITTDVPPPKA